MSLQLNQKQVVEIPVASSLPMDERVQSALLGHCIKDDKIFNQVERKLQPNWFLNPWDAKIFAIMKAFADRVKRAPAQVELETCREMVIEDAPNRLQLQKAIRRAVGNADFIKWDSIRADLTEWLQSKILQDSIRKSTTHWNSGNWHASARIMGDAVQLYRDAQFEEGIEVGFDNPEVYLLQQAQEKGNAITTGSPLLDQALLDGATSGSLQYGDTTLVLAPSNVGKTTFMLSVGVHNVLSNKDVLVMTHEGRPEDIRLKILKALLGVSEQELLALYQTKEGLARIHIATNLLKAKLTYIPYNKAGMKVEDVVPIIRRAQEDRRAKTGKGYDLLICDYPAKLTTDQAGKALQLRNVMEIVYDYYVQLALEYKFHSLLAIQTNREGSKVNNGQNANRLLMMEDVLEAWGPMTSASNVITLNRSPAAKRNNRLTLYAAKSRSSDTGKAIVVRTNYKVGLTHHPAWPSLGYYGTSTLDAVLDGWLQDPNRHGRMFDERGNVAMAA
ncbi:DNA primase-helicase [Myxococcus phage Mx1]|nr:DNA primase-helicase [Myxococcus phage Mx1]